MIGDDYPPARQALQDFNAVDEISALLEEMADLIDRVERASAGGTPAKISAQIVAQQAETRQLMQRLGAAINALLATEPPADLISQAYTLVTSRVRAWSATSRLYYHIFNTPRDRLGPYEVYDLLLDRRSGGADVAGLMLDQYYMNTVTATAFRLRNKLLTRRLAAEISGRATRHRPVRLLNLHTGSGQELQTLVRDRALRSVMQVTCLDTDASALRQVKQTLGPQFVGRENFQFGDPRKIVASRAWPDAPYDIIYALILFDQLSDRQVEPLIANCYRGLRPGGVLVFGNYAASMPTEEHTLINWVLNLNLRRRDEVTLRQIFSRTPFGEDAATYELDSFAASWLVIAERK